MKSFSLRRIVAVLTTSALLALGMAATAGPASAAAAPMRLTFTTTVASAQVSLPLRGTVTSITVSWGDGSSTTVTSLPVSHTYALAGTYQVAIGGTALSAFGSGTTYTAWTGAKYLKSVDDFGTLGTTDFMGAFNGASALTAVPAALPLLVTNTSNMFNGATVFNQNISNWNTAYVTTMSGMFFGAKAFNQNISNWNTGKVADMSYMFYQAEKFNQPLPQAVDHWNTSSVTTMQNMFQSATVFNQPVGTWNTAKVTEMSGLFYRAVAFNQNISSWNTGLVTRMNSMFAYASAFNQPIGSWNTQNVQDMGFMFGAASSFNQPIGTWNTGKVIVMYVMFSGASAFNQPIGTWNTQNVTDIDGMFANASAFNQSISGWNTGLITNMSSMFSGATSFNQSLGIWDINQVTTMAAMLNNSGMSGASYDATLTGWAAQTPTIARALGATGLRYTPGLAARASLATTYRWTITGDIPSRRPMTMTITTTSASTLVQLPLNGTVTAITVYWGDGSSSPATGPVSHTYATAGTYHLSVTGDRVSHFGNAAGWQGAGWVTSVEDFGDLGTTDLSGAFRDNYRLVSVPAALPAGVTNLSYMFYNSAEGFNQDLSSWDTSSVVSMVRMFTGSTAFNRSLGSWDITRVVDMTSMLDLSGLSLANYEATLTGWAPSAGASPPRVLGALGLNYTPGLIARDTLVTTNGWTIVGDSPVVGTTPMKMTFTTPADDAAVTLPLVGASSITVNWGDGTSDLISGAASHTYAVAGTYDVTVSGVALTGFGDGINTWQGAEYLTRVIDFGTLGITTLSGAFRGATSLIAVPDALPPGVTNTSYMFYFASAFNDDISGWDTSSVTNMSYMFSYAPTFNQPIGSWDTSSVNTMYRMFRTPPGSAFNQDLSGWNTGAVTTMGEMFYGASAFNGAVGTWDTSRVTTMSKMFSNAGNFNQPIGDWNTIGVTNMSNMFYVASAFNQPIGDWNTINVVGMSYMFFSASAFNQPIGDWNTGKVSTMRNMFSGAAAFNQPISTWDTAQVVYFDAMFNGASTFDQPIDSWTTTSAVSMNYMFWDATAFNRDISAWNTAGVQYMEGMFQGASAFNQPLPQSAGHWNTGSVNTMFSMFENAVAFNQDLSSWNTGGVSNMFRMFSGASSFDQNLGAWDINQNINMGEMLNGSGLSMTNYDATLTGWAGQAPSARTLGASGLIYAADLAARATLVNTYGWNITEDAVSTPPSVGSVSVVGTVQAGSAVSADVADVTGIPTPTLAYQWKSSATSGGPWVNVASANGRVLLIADGLVGRYLQACVTASNTVVPNAVLCSAATAPVAGVAPSVRLPSGFVIGGGTLAVRSTVTSYAPSADGAPAPTVTYQWQSSANRTTGWASISGATARAYVIAPSQFGRYLRVKVTASNGVGSPAVAYSDASATAVAAATPNVPRSVKGLAGNKAVVVSWTAPVDNGGAAINFYQVTATPKVGTVTRTCTTATNSGALSCQVTGLAAGVGYRFTVKAHNSVGFGAASAQSAAVTPIAITWTKVGQVVTAKFKPVLGATKYTEVSTGATKASGVCTVAGTGTARLVTCVITLASGTSTLTVSAATSAAVLMKSTRVQVA